MGLVIRKAVESDVNEITQCVANAFKKYVPVINRKPQPMLLDFKKVIKSDNVYVAIVDGNLSGVIVLSAKGGEGEMLLSLISVIEESQGEGIGGALITFAEGFAREMNKHTLWLFTNAAYENNLEVFNYLGFEEYNRATDQGYEKVFLRKEV